MKKLSLYIFPVLMFLTSNALAEKINYKCFFPSGSPFPDQFSIDTTRKMVDKFPFEKGSTDTIVKIASFFDTEKKGVLMGMFYTIDLLDDTVLVQKVMEINRLQQIIGRDDPFKMIPPDTMEVLLNCERSGAKSSETEAVLTDRSLIEPNYYCKAKQFGAGYSKLLNIEILPNDNFSLEYIWKLDEGESTPVRYHATFDRGQLMWFDLIKGTDTSTGKPNLYSYQLLQEKNQKREFRILAYIISQNEYDNLKPLYDQIMFFDGSDESIKLEEKFYEEAIKSFNKIQGETSEFEYGFQYDCDTNPESILAAQEENVPESSLPIYDLTAFEKKYLEEKGYNLDSNSEYFETDFSNAMTTFGWNYIEGLDGFDQNNEKAILWNTRASEWGHSTASSNLGLFYYAGLVGLKQDLKLAHKYYVLAAEQWDTSPHEPEAIVEEMNKYNPNPTKEFENLRDLFLAATKLRSEKRMNRLRDLVDLSQVKDEKVTVQDFIKRGLIYCTGNNKISIHRLLSENTLLLKDLDTTGWDITEEQKIKNLRFARYNNEKVEWFEIVDAIVGIIEPALWRYEVYFDQKKHKQLVFQSESYFTTEKQYMKLRGPQSIATKEKLSGMGGPKHIRYENIFFDEASKMFKKLSKISKDNIKETHTCE